MRRSLKTRKSTNKPVTDFNRLSKGFAVFGLILLFMAGILAPSFAQTEERICESDAVCGALAVCPNHVEVLSWTNYQAWLNAHPFTPHERIHSTSSNVIIVWTEKCPVKQGCWDYLGLCRKDGI